MQFTIVINQKNIFLSHITQSKLDDLIVGLQQNQLLDVYSHLLTGYIGKDSFLCKIADTVKKLRAVNSKLVYGKQSFLFRPNYIIHDYY